MKGIIALDIDGTITTAKHELHPAVKKYLESLAREGWRFIFITGRTFTWGLDVLKQFSFPYHVAVQNGAIILKMPGEVIISKKYLNKSIFAKMEAICKNEPTDFVVFSGYEFGDQTYFRPDYFDKDLLKYLTARFELAKECWVTVSSFDEVPQEDFASVKCFGLMDSAKKIARQIEDELGLHVPLIRDPFQEDYYIVQAIHPHLSKGEAVKEFKKIVGGDLEKRVPVIAAGDDTNDISMLQEADIKIVMATAPREVLALADIIAPPASDCGIIKGLEEALTKL